MQEKLQLFERDLLRIPGVTSARVTGVDAPSEIHIVADPERPAKQLVRDVQSLASAAHGLAIDHRLVSIVQLGASTPPPQVVSDSDHKRPRLERVVFANKGSKGWVKVALEWPSGETSEGTGVTSASRVSRARGAATAALEALSRVINNGTAVDVDQLSIERVGDTESVVVRALYQHNGTQQALMGSAVIRDDVATAAVHALLHAVNRKIEIGGRH